MKNGVQLVAGILTGVLGVATLLAGHIQSATVREMRASGPRAQVIAVLLLIMSVIILVDWIKNFRDSRR
jgi:hypothetical protein